MRVNQKHELLFLLDTGASSSVIDEKTVEKLGLPVTGNTKVEGSTRVIDVRTTRIKSVSAGKINVKNLRPTVQNLAGFLTPRETSIDGILGYDFLRFVSVYIDFKNTRIMFYRNSDDDLNRQSGSKAISVPFVSDNGIPRISAFLNDIIKADFRIDTGASLFDTSDVYLNITDDNWKSLTTTNSALVPEKYFNGGSLGGEMRLAVARIDKLSIGSQVISHPFVIVQPKVGYFARPDAVGFISNNLLEKYSPITIDYIKNKIYLNTHGSF